MKSTVEQLSGAERKALAHLYDTPAYSALKKLLEFERLNSATKCLSAGSFEEVKYLQGQESALKGLHLTIKQLHKESDKES